MGKIVQITLNVLSVFMALSIAITLYWVLKDYDIIEWRINHYEMQKEVYKVGEKLTFRTAFCKNGHYEADIVYNIEDGVTYLMPQLLSRSDEGCHDFISSTLEVPNIPSGEYRIKGTIIYKVNPLKTVTYTMYSNKFYIQNNGEKNN